MGTSSKSNDLVRLSRAVSHALRHEPGRYGLLLDAEGWARVEDLLTALHRRPSWARLTPTDLARMIARSDKPRFELRGDRIRARYGHSLAVKVPHPRERPPAVLYHGTTPEAAARILVDGLRPMRRQYVHLSVDADPAREVGRRRTPRPIVLTVRAGEAHDAGVPFYRAEAAIWLADQISPEFLEEDEGAPDRPIPAPALDPAVPRSTPRRAGPASGRGGRS